MSLTSVTILRQRGPVSQEEPIAAPEGLRVDFDVCLSREEDDSRAPGYGHDIVARYPARIGNTPCVLERRRWVPAEGYSAEGEEDAILSYVWSADFCGGFTLRDEIAGPDAAPVAGASAGVLACAPPLRSVWVSGAAVVVTADSPEALVALGTRLGQTPQNMSGAPA